MQNQFDVSAKPKYDRLGSVLSNKRIIINTQGVRHKISLDKLNILPRSRLTRLKNCLVSNKPDPDELDQLCDNYDLNKREFCFNRDPHIMNLILLFYSKDCPSKIHYNFNHSNFCVFQLEEEFNYWGIDYEELIEPCCMLRINREKEFVGEELKKEKKIIENLDYKDNFGDRYFPKAREFVWNLLDNPRSSAFAKLVQLISIILILLSTIAVVISTLPQYQIQDSNSVNSTENSTMSDKSNEKYTVRDLAYYVEIISTAWFTLDYIARLISTPMAKFKFIIQPLNIIDLVSNLPFYIDIIFSNYDNITDIKYMLRFFQIMRILRIARHFSGLQSLGYTFSKSKKELLLLIAFLGISLLVFASLVYFFEKDQPDTTFISIPASLWWALVTMTSVGYGDMLPYSIPGKIIAGMCAVLGLMIIAMPTAIISTNFSAFYAEKTKIEKIKKRNDLRKRKEKLKHSNSIFERNMYGETLEEAINVISWPSKLLAFLKLILKKLKKTKTENKNSTEKDLV